LSVKAKDKTTNKEQSIRIEASSGLSKEDIAKMQKDAEVHAEEDKKKKELIEAKNISEQLVYTAEKAVKDNGDKAGEEIKKDVEGKIDALKKAQGGTSLEDIKKASDELSTSMSKIGEAISKQNQESEKQSNPENKDQKGGNDESGPVRDADFKETK